MNGIWIKAQSKGLYLCIGFDPPERKERARYENKPYVITGHVSDGIQPWLGWYATEDRALEVLDEIQQFIACNGEMNGCKFNVFEMPAE